jgi:deazaflavin-dependent oxidoreductase (nitroreductase family)
VIATTASRVEQLRQRFYRAFARAHHAVMVHSGGRPGWLTPKLRVLVLTATGRRSGRPRQATLAYLPHQDGYAVLATNLGRAHHPGWYHNLVAHPDAAVTIAGRTTPVRARVLTGDDRDGVIGRAQAHNAQWRYYLAHTDREIPVVLLQPSAENPGRAAP